MVDSLTPREIAPLLRSEFIPRGVLATNRSPILAAIVRCAQEKRIELSDELRALCEPVNDLSAGEQNRLQQITALLGGPVLKEARLDQLIGVPAPVERTKSRHLAGSSHSTASAGKWRASDH